MMIFSGKSQIFVASVDVCQDKASTKFPSRISITTQLASCPVPFSWLFFQAFSITSTCTRQLFSLLRVLPQTCRFMVLRPESRPTSHYYLAHSTLQCQPHAHHRRSTRLLRQKWQWRNWTTQEAHYTPRRAN